MSSGHRQLLEVGVFDTVLRRLSNKLPTEGVHDVFRKKVGHVQRTGQAPAPWIVNAFKSLRVTWFLEASSDEIATMSMRENIGRAIPKAKAQRVRQHLPSQIFKK